MREPTQEVFLKDVATHVMSVKLDRGIYRHLEFRQADGSWNHGFHIITTPWRLIITGDMGTWVFSRLEDMFCFFRSKDGRINLGYWAEKCVNGAHGCSQECKVYDGDAYKANLIGSLNNYDLTDEQRAKVVKELDEIDFSDRYRIVGEIEGFKVYLDEEDPYITTAEFVRRGCPPDRKREVFRFVDVWEVEIEEYSYHFIWCCYAIAWAIQQYDAARAEKETAA